jgi:hypothetical protein
MNCFRAICFALAAGLGLGLASGPVWGQGGVKLAPLFSHNMVLQQGAVNTLWGWAKPGQYVAITYQEREYGPEKVAKSGAWTIELDLRAKLGPVSGQMLIKTGPKKGLEAALVLTNVAVGEVWLLGVVNEKGVPAPGPLTEAEWAAHRRQPDFFRFVTITNLSATTDSASAQGVSWHLGSPGCDGFEELRVLAYYWAFHLRDLHPRAIQYIGIIQSRTNEVGPWLRPGSWSSSPDRARAQRFEDLHAVRTIAYENARGAVARAQQARRQALIDAKHAGEVIQPAPIFQYDPPSVYLLEAFKPKLPTWLPSFEGAVW